MILGREGRDLRTKPAEVHGTPEKRGGQLRPRQFNADHKLGVRLTADNTVSMM